jgi:hypothetical protein
MVTGQQQLTDLTMLTSAINTGTNKKVAFLTQANFDGVHNVLPSTVEPIICDGRNTSVGQCSNTDELIGKITSGLVLAGLISGLPEAQFASQLNTFSSTVVSTRAMFMRPSYSADTPHGSPTNQPAISSFDLSKAVDAAIVSLQQAGKDEAIRLQNMPFEFMAVHTCKGDDLSAFQVPNSNAATGLLSTVLSTKVLKIGALGPYDWGGNDGNYKVTPYTGFYPDWLTEFCNQFNNLAGPDGVKYNNGGAISCTRVWQLGSAGVFRDLFDGHSHVTEPYYIVDSFYTGTGDTCTTNADCRLAATASGRETCSTTTNSQGVTTSKCSHPKSPRTRHFRVSCSTIGVDSTFMTKNVVVAQAAATVHKDDDDTDLIIVLIVAIVCGLFVLVLCGLTCYMYKREKSGKPMFAPLVQAPKSNMGGMQIGSDTI